MMEKHDITFESCLLEQLSKHPAMQAQDLVKLCYHAACGADHLLRDLDGVRAYFLTEYENTPPAEGDLYEPVSGDFARVNIAQWKQRGLKADWLFKLFCLSAVHDENSREKLLQNLKTVESMLHHSHVSRAEWDEYTKDYVNRGLPAVHHSDVYRQAERPAYRLVKLPLLRLLPVLELVVGKTAKPCIIAIDGRAGSGKSTLAQALSKLLDADLVHMDDFFLPLELRSDSRLSAPGGNVHYERFKAEVLPKLRSAEGFSYNVFSCSEMRINGSREVKSPDYRIVEGSYSLHPKFGDYADIRVFSNVEAEEQLRRIRLRDGERAAQIFASRWIPMEEKYFAYFKIAEKCDMTI